MRMRGSGAVTRVSRMEQREVMFVIAPDAGNVHDDGPCSRCACRVLFPGAPAVAPTGTYWPRHL